jgi:hypothetical protein
MKRLVLIPLLVVAAACPGDKKPKADTAAAIPVDTTAQDLSKISTDLPPADKDTFKLRTLPAQPEQQEQNYANAPAALMDAVQRQQSTTQFCFQEFGQKADPTLRGNVAMLVSVGSSGITETHVANSNWTGKGAGAAVNNCLSQKAKAAWKIAPGAVKPGRYVVQLSFRGS